VSMIGSLELILNQDRLSSVNITRNDVCPEHPYWLFFGLQDKLHIDGLC